MYLKLQSIFGGLIKTWLTNASVQHTALYPRNQQKKETAQNTKAHVAP
jgi:hypothetical protein